MSLQVIGFFATFLIAMIYSSAGYGGGSSYLSIMAMINIPYKTYPTLALICNLIVVSGSAFKFLKQKLIEWKKIFPWIIPSIPLAYFGSRTHMPEKSFISLLSLLLFIAGLRIILNNLSKKESVQIHVPGKIKTSLIGGSLGMISGIVGIGGGIFLSPLMHYWKMDRARNIAIMTTLFIFFNSLSGLIGKMQDPDKFLMSFNYWPFLLAVFVGGQVGSHWCLYKASEKEIAIISGALSIIASITLWVKVF